MKEKKAQLQIQFNWIFVIIVGSVFLIFFFGLINSQSKTTDQRISISQSKYFETVITATGQKVGTLKEYEIPGLEVEFFCNAKQLEYSYSVENLPSRDTKYDVIFTQKKLEGDDIQTWTQTWNVPFKAATFLYITNSKQGYIFYNYSEVKGLPGPTSKFEEIQGEFPQNISMDVVDGVDMDWDDVVERNYESNTYVFIKGEEPDISLDNFNINKKNTIVIIDPLESGADNIFNYGTVYYLTPKEYVALVNQLPTSSDPSQSEKDKIYSLYDSISQKTTYLGKASLYGTIFSEDKDIYECNMQKAFSRLKLITQLYFIRAGDITLNEDLDFTCRRSWGYYDAEGASAQHPLQRLNYLYTTLIPEIQENFDADKSEALNKKLQELNDDSNNILILYKCPAIY